MFLRSSEVYAMKKDMYKWAFETHDTISPVYASLFEQRKSQAAYEIEVSAVGMSKLAKKTEGNQIVYRDPMEGYPVYGRNFTYTDGIAMSYEAVKDNQKIENVLKAASQTWGFAAAETQDDFYADVFNKGGYLLGDSMFNASITGVVTDPAGDFIYDGRPLICLSGNNHTAKSGSTYYNGLAAGLTYADLKTLYLLMTVTNAYNEVGEKVNIVPDTLVVPGALKFTAQEILESEKDAGTALNTKNVLQNIVKLVVWHELTDTDAYFLMKAKKGLIAMDREGIIIDFFQDQDTKSFKANVSIRFGLMINNWRYIAASNLATA